MDENLENTYIFIIWSKVSWCKKRIINDLKNCFEILKIINVAWDSDLFEENLASFYGSKIANYKEKIKRIGNKEFILVIIKDLNPVYEQKYIYNRYEKVNINVYNKKKLYREWTGTNFRIHSSDNIEETKHDLCVLLGPNFNEYIANDTKEETISINTYRFTEIKNIEELEKALYYFGNNIFIKNNANYYIFSINKTNIIRFLNITKVEKYKYSIEINKEKKTLYLFGEEEGEIPEGFVEKAKSDNNLIIDFIDIIDKYILFLINRNETDQSTTSFINKYNFNLDYSEHGSVREDENTNTIYKLKKSIKYILARASNIIYSIKEKNEKRY